MFNRSSFSPVSFSLISFNGAREDTGRSGYWRLFFTQMQEEADKERDEKATKDSGKLVAPEVVVAKVKKQPKPVVPKKRKKVEVKKLAPIVPFRKIPAKIEPTAYDELAKLPPVTVEFYLASMHMTTVIDMEDERRKRRKRQRKIAAILLLAA